MSEHTICSGSSPLCVHGLHPRSCVFCCAAPEIGAELARLRALNAELVAVLSTFRDVGLLYDPISQLARTKVGTVDERTKLAAEITP